MHALQSQVDAWPMSRSRRRNAKYVRSTVSISAEPSTVSVTTYVNAASPSSFASRKVGRSERHDRVHEVGQDVLGVVELDAGEIARVAGDVGDHEAGGLGRLRGRASRPWGP